MKLSDLSTGPDWIVWVIFAIFAVLSVILISGHGAWLIASYNTESKEEKAKYNVKKLCRVTGIGMSVVSVLLFIMGLFEDVLPASFAYFSIVIIVVDVFLMIIIGNVSCKR